MTDRYCRECGKVITDPLQRKYCSEECRKRHYGLSIIPRTETCPVCGKHIKSADQHSQRKYCSATCREIATRQHKTEQRRAARPQRTCKLCGKIMGYDGTSRLYCSPECRAEAARKRTESQSKLEESALQKRDPKTETYAEYQRRRNPKYYRSIYIAPGKRNG